MKPPTRLLVVAGSWSLLTFATVGRCWAQTASPAAEVPVAASAASHLDPSLSPLRDLLERYAADRSNLRRFYRIRMSPSAAERSRRFYLEWQRALEAVDFDALAQDARVDYLLLHNQLQHALKELDHEGERSVEVRPVLPFWEIIVDLEERRRRMEPIDPAGAAKQLTALIGQIKEAQKAVEAGLKGGDDVAGSLKVAPAAAGRAASLAGSLRNTLAGWYRFYNGYHPEFTWWARNPYEEADRELEGYTTFLRRRVALKGGGDDALVGDPIGREALLDELAYEMIPYTPEELIEIANREFAWCEAEMLRASRDLGYGERWREALEHVKTLHVAPGRQPQLIRDLAVEAVEFLDKHDLVTVPELCRETWRMEMMSPQRQRISPYFTGGEVISVSFPTDGMTHEQKLMSMRGNNIHFSRATVHHELIPGHHLQGFMSQRYRTHRRQFRTPFFAEGWALYWEMLLWDMEFAKSPEDRLGMLFWRMHRCARIIFSLSFHLEKMTADEAVDFLIERVGHERNNATAEVRRSISGGYGPLYQCAYMLGGLQLRALHRETVGSDKMNNREFHDAVLRENAIPIELIRASLTGQELTRNFSTSWRFYALDADTQVDETAAAAAATEPYSPDLAADYRRAEHLRAKLQGKTFRAQVDPHWLDGTPRFWYRNRLAGDRKEFVLVDAEQAVRRPAFDHVKLAAALSEAAGAVYTADQLPFDAIEFIDDAGAVRFQVGGTLWECDLNRYTCSKAQHEEKEQEEPSDRRRRRRGPRRVVRSPDGKWLALVRDHNLFLRVLKSEAVEGPDDEQAPQQEDNAEADGQPEDSQELQLTEDGDEAHAYAAPRWSPDSRTLLAHRVEPGKISQVHLVESSPAGSTKARLHTRSYAQPGDPLPVYEMWLFDVESRNGRKIQSDRVDFGGPPRPQWAADNSRFYYVRQHRGHQRVRVVEVDLASGNTRDVVDERADTFIDGTQIYLHAMKGSDEIIWASERDGWRHLYLIDRATGEVKNQITKGPWVVRGVQHVDDEARQIFFSGSGRNDGEDPYHVHHYRVNFDGSELVALTSGNGNHAVRFSPDRKYLVDTYSRVDQPPVTELRRTEDGSLVCLLEKADVSDLVATGWKPPGVFHTKGRDGQTDIWGIVFRPSNLDETKKYPVIENIYAGPHGSHVPKSFRAYYEMQALAELGFIVVQIDGMGTSHRSKAFHDVCWKNLADAGLPDRILWIKALGERYAYVDTTRVGIYGTSAGGQSSTGALLFHPEFYKVAVSACGCHDNRVDKRWWNEQWMGYPVGEHYAEQSNVTNAHKLQGKLLLIVGEMDRNVPPESTLQVVHALIEAGKDFDLLFVPGMGHSSGGAYGERRRRDFFVRHLHGVEPPDRNAVAVGTE